MINVAMIVAGDFTTSSVDWGMPNRNTRGQYILELSAEMEPYIINGGKTIGNICRFWG